MQFVTLLPTRSDDEVLAYWCVFSGESDGGWVRADRVLEYHPLLLTRVRVKFDDEWYSAQKKALDFAQKEYFRACNDDEPIRDLTSETNKLVNELLILVNRTRNYPDDEDELLTVCDSDSVSTLPESPPRDVKPIIRKRKQVRETPRKRQRRAPRHDASSSAFSSAINHPRGSIKRELIEANRASSDRDEPSKRAAEAQASDAEEDEDEPDSPSESEDNATEYTPPAYIKSEPREELTYTPATMALPRAGSRRRRMPKRVLPNRAAARRQAGATSPDFDDEQRITRIEKPVRRREQEVAHLPRQKSQLCRDAGALAPSGFPTYAQCMRSTDAQLFRQCAEKIRTTVSKFQESVDKCARKLEEYQEAERGVRYAYNCMQNAVGETEERFIGAQTTLQSILDLARSTRYRTAGSDVEEE